MPDGPWNMAWRAEAYSHARKLYIQTGDADAFDNMLRWVTLEGDYWKILGDDPDIAWHDGMFDITTEGVENERASDRKRRP